MLNTSSVSSSEKVSLFISLNNNGEFSVISFISLLSSFTSFFDKTDVSKTGQLLSRIISSIRVLIVDIGVFALKSLFWDTTFITSLNSLANPLVLS